MIPSFCKRQINKNVPDKVMRKRIQSLNLLPIKEKLMTPKEWGGFGWSRQKANKIEKAYRGFLYVYWKYDTCAPNRIIDDFWHTHILMTPKYIEDCNFLWGAYAHHVPSPAPRKMLIKSCDYLGQGGLALDLGCGNLRDSRHLLVRGFKVIGVDKKRPAKIVAHKDFKFIKKDIEKYTIDNNKYDLINAQFTLPFIKDDVGLIKRVNKGLKNKGLFTGQIFGLQDEWNTKNNTKIHFYSKEDALKLLKGFKIIYFKEFKGVFNTMDGEEKYWNYFDFIVQK